MPSQSMENIPATKTRARLRTWLAIGYALFIMYASLSPFTGWREQGLSFGDVASLPLGLTYTAFDATVNLFSYLPFGLLVGLALRARFGAAVSLASTFCSGVMMSACMEYLQMYLPTRTSSNMDMLSNSAGTLLGALVAAGITSRPRLFARLTDWRTRAFNHGKEVDFGLALLALWMFGQINPSLPILGNVFISEVARQPFVEPSPARFDWWESGAVSLNLLMLGALMLTLLRVRRNVLPAMAAVLCLLALAKFAAAALLLKSWALLLWINSEAMLGILAGMLLLAALSLLPLGAIISSGALAALSYLVIVNLVFDDNTPAAAMSIYHWHYGHLLNYNGLAQTITLVFPLLLLFHLTRIRTV